ncbi:MAG: hypothetical protein WC974_07735 [Thermoplasmata archaeon]
METHYNRNIGILFVLLGAILLVATALTYPPVYVERIIVIVVCLIFGILMLSRRPYFTVTDNEILIKALIGPAKKTYKINSIGDVVREGNKLYIMQNGNKTKLPVSKFMSDKNDWTHLLESIKSK